jgi:thioredoxin 1
VKTVDKERFIEKFGIDMKSPQEKHTIINIGAISWCHPCKTLHPILEDLEKEHPEIDFYDIDTETNQELVEELRITSIPTLFFLKGDGSIKNYYGSVPKFELEKYIQFSFQH